MLETQKRSLTLVEFLKIPETKPASEYGDIAHIFPIYPDWTIEILSPAQNQTKVTSNILYCLDCGTQLGWLIDPESRCVLIFPPKQQPILLEASLDVIPVPSFAQRLQLTVGELFAWLKLP